MPPASASNQRSGRRAAAASVTPSHEGDADAQKRQKVAGDALGEAAAMEEEPPAASSPTAAVADQGIASTVTAAEAATPAAAAAAAPAADKDGDLVMDGLPGDAGPSPEPPSA